MSNEGCLSGHYWHGSSLCTNCGERLRCLCGVFIREDNLEKHLSSTKHVKHPQSPNHSEGNDE